MAAKVKYGFEVPPVAPNGAQRRALRKCRSLLSPCVAGEGSVISTADSYDCLSSVASMGACAAESVGAGSQLSAASSSSLVESVITEDAGLDARGTQALNIPYSR